MNTALESDNKIHDDRVAAQYGFKGGLVPGVTVYGYMSVPLVACAPEWAERGSMQVRFIEPVYDGDDVIARAEPAEDGSIAVTTERSDGTICARGTATIRARSTPAVLPDAPLPLEPPAPDQDTVVPGRILGSVVASFAPVDSNDSARALLQFSNEMLAQNFRLGPWIHVSSEIENWSAPHPGDEIRACGRIHDRFDRKGHEFVVIDVTLLGHRDQLIQTVRHTAIYRPRAMMDSNLEHS